MGTVAGTEPAAEVTCFADGDTTQVCAHAQHDEPFGFLDAVSVGLGVAEGVDAESQVSKGGTKVVDGLGVG
jgi:hypothetical protein